MRGFSVFAVLICITACLLFSACGASVGEHADVGEKPEKVKIEKTEDLSKYTIIRPDLSSDVITRAAMDLRDYINEKTGLSIKLKTDLGLAVSDENYEIVISVKGGKSKDFARYEYEMRTEGNRLYLLAGSDKIALELIEDLKARFIDLDKKKLSFPENGEYVYRTNYYFGDVKIEGVDLSDFSLYVDPEDTSFRQKEIISEVIAKELTTKLACAETEKGLEISDELRDGGHYIILSAHSLNVRDYSVEIKDGNVYITGSVASIDEAVKTFARDMISSKDKKEDVDLNKTVELTENDSRTGSLTTLEVPYTKEDVLRAYEDALRNDDMIISGSHAYGGWGGQGYPIAATADVYEAATGKIPVVIEVSISATSPINTDNKGESTFGAYDLSTMLSEAAEHVANGGIIAINDHFSNPIQENRRGDSHFRGLLGDDTAFQMLCTDGTKLNKSFLASFEPTYRLLEALHENGIPVLYRPFHEMQGGWFWWCIYQGKLKIRSDTWVNMWRYFHDYVTEDLGFDNILWIYSTTTYETMYCYPGDDYVDLVGMDIYPSGEGVADAYGREYAHLATSGKPIGFSEIGPGGAYNSEFFLNDMKEMLSRGMNISYFCSWANYHSVIGMGRGEILMNDPMIYSRDDMMTYWGK